MSLGRPKVKILEPFIARLAALINRDARRARALPTIRTAGRRSAAILLLAEDSALIDAGLDFALGERTTAGLSYSGQFGDGVTDNAVKGRFAWIF